MTLTSFTLACSGPGAEATVRTSNAISNACAVIGGVLLLLFWGWWRKQTRRRGHPLAVAGLLMFLHPAWMMSALQGDCGYFKRDVSYAVTALFVALVVWQHVLARREMSGSTPKVSGL
ncbi:MAG: hypothetical protein ACO1TE_17395 [Prosthecobacter sp.]